MKTNETFLIFEKKGVWDGKGSPNGIECIKIGKLQDECLMDTHNKKGILMRAPPTQRTMPNNKINKIETNFRF